MVLKLRLVESGRRPITFTMAGRTFTPSTFTSRVSRLSMGKGHEVSDMLMLETQVK